MRSTTCPGKGARITARSTRWRVRSRAARAWSSSCRAIERRAAASSIWLFEAMPVGSAVSRCSCVSSSSAFAARRATWASSWRSWSSSARESTRATGAPFAMRAPGSATQSRRPATSAARRASLRLTTVPVAVTVVASEPSVTLATDTAAGGGWFWAQAALAAREVTASAANAAPHATGDLGYREFIGHLP